MRASGLQHGLQVLELLRQKRGPMRFKELQEQVEVSVPTLSAILKMFLDEGYLSKSVNGYGLGNEFLAMAFIGSKYNTLRIHSRPFLLQLRKETGLTAELAVWDKGVFHLDQVESEQGIRLYADAGFRMNLKHSHAQANGKVLLAFNDDLCKEAFPDQKLETLTDRSVWDYDSLMSELEQVKRNRLAVDFGEARVGVARIAAPVFEDGTILAGAIGVAGDAEEIKADQTAISQYVIQAARTVSDELGGVWNQES